MYLLCKHIWVSVWQLWLHDSCFTKYYSIVHSPLICGCILCEMSIIIHSSLQDGQTSLMWACEYGDAEVVRILVSAGAHVNHQSKVSSTSAS